MAKTPLKILMIVTRLNIGGPAVQVITLARALSGGRFETVLACGRLGKGEGDMGYLARDMGVSPVYIPTMGRELSVGDDLKALWALVRLIVRVRPDIVHTHTAKAGTLGRTAVLIARVLHPFGKPVRMVHTFHGHTFHSYFGHQKTRFFKTVERVLSSFTDRIIALSPMQKSDLCRTYRIAPEHKVTVMALGLDWDRFHPSTMPAGDDLFATWFSDTRRKVYLVGLVGRLVDVKNPAMILDVARIIRQMGRADEFRFVLVGDGELKRQLIQETRILGIDRMLAFAGWHKDIAPIYRLLDAVVLTSRNEGTPVSLIEAMVSEKPVIATDVGGVRDLLGKQETRTADRFRIMENGILVDPEDAEAMARALVALKAQQRFFQKKAKRAGQTVKRRFSRHRIIREATALYLSLSGKR